MKIVHIEDFFHPDAGYQVNILGKYLSQMGHDVCIITAELDKIPDYLTDFFGKDDIDERDARFRDTYGVRIKRIPLRGYISGRAIYDNKVFSEIEVEKPDILYVHGCDTYIGIQILRRAGKMKYKIITDTHMLDAASQNPLRGIFRKYYKLFVTPYITKYKIPVIRVVDSDYVKKRLGIPLSQCPLISFGTDTLLFHPDEMNRLRFLKENNIPEDAFTICYAGKLDEAKGGKILAQALQKKFTFDKKIVCIIAGNSSGVYGVEVEEIFNTSENKIIRLPTQRYEDLALIYQASDLCVFPRACSLSFFDVQACGVPVISEDMDINQKRCDHGNGLNFKHDSIEDLRNCIQTFLNLSQEEQQRMKQNSSAYIRKNFDYSEILKDYTKLFDKTINEDTL